MIFLNASIVAALTVVLVTLLATAYQQTQQRAPNSTGNPYWRRPGCHQVGHTRTISIPGCVKFNLSTNACRGYCMSYAIPTEEDIGPPSGETEIEEAKSVQDEQEELQLKKQHGNGVVEDKSQVEALKKHNQRLTSSNDLLANNYMSGTELEIKSAINKWPKTQFEFQNENLFDKSTLLSSESQTSGLGASAVRREVISVSQCCNMMNTEDVIVNLRCANGTRQYIFKSAKSCECVFCKHL